MRPIVFTIEASGDEHPPDLMPRALVFTLLSSAGSSTGAEVSRQDRGRVAGTIIGITFLVGGYLYRIDALPTILSVVLLGTVVGAFLWSLAD